MNQRAFPQLMIPKTQVVILSVVASLLLLALFYSALNLVQNLAEQTHLLQNDLARSIRSIAQLQREVLRLFVLVKNADREMSHAQFSLQIDLVSSRLTAMQRHYTNYKSEVVLENLHEIEIKWGKSQKNLTSWVQKPSDFGPQAKLSEELTELELMINELQGKHEIWYSRQSATLAEQSLQSLRILGNISLLFALFLSFVVFNTSRLIRERGRVIGG